ncbi:MAG: GTP 3',8-cyclase MoaA [Oscillospiraceae bacterium]
MRDLFGRNLTYLRVSVTDRCNLRCSYCMPPEGIKLRPHYVLLTLEEIHRLCQVFAQLGVQKLKVTGGEPLVRKGVAEWLSTVAAIPGINEVTLTTNGVQLSSFLPQIQRAGVKAINISLDTLDKDKYRRLTGSDNLETVLAGLRQAVNMGITTKVNVVPLRGVNEVEYPALAALTQEGVKAVRFIELMPVGYGADSNGVLITEVKEALEAEYGSLQKADEVLGNGPAEYYTLANGGKVGFITAVSHAFCSSCNRLRLTSDGYLKMCLAYEAGVDLKKPMRRGAADEDLKQLILEAVRRKPLMHCFATEKAEGNGMYAIGG